MTVVNFKHHRPADKNFNNLVENFFNGFPSMLKDNVATPGFRQIVPVNIIEQESGFEVEVVAPGFEKDQFEISLDKNVLTVSANLKSENEAKTGKHLKREYGFQSFKRSFSVGEHIDTEHINAQYVNGILRLNLPKRVEVKEPVKQINIQ
jgi:HSP20 family protein